MREIYNSECDDRLMCLSATGDREAFDSIVGKYQNLLQRYGTRLAGRNREIAEDAVVRTFTRLWMT